MHPRLAIALALVLPSATTWAQDSDGDGAADVADVYPCDPAAAAVGFEPSETGWGTILFEDQWPLQGDLDFNDTALAFHFVHARDAAGRTARIRATFHARAVGGRLDLGLGLHLPIAASNVARVSRTIGGVTEVLAPRDDAELTVVLSENLREVFGGQAGQINVVPGQAALGAQSLVVDIELTTPTFLASGSAPHDLFVFRTADPAHEIHRPEFAGTARMRQSLFGTGDDGSSASRRFVDRDGLPFALVFPALVDHPLEGVEISTLWPHVTAFAASAGASNRDFYLRDVDASAAYGEDTDPPALSARATLHQELGSCLDAPRACTVPNGSGTQWWTGSAWSSCQVERCSAGHHLEASGCASDTRACAIVNGVGTQTWTGAGWSACGDVRCTAGQLTPSGTGCVVPRSCNDALQRGFTASGIYEINPSGSGSFPAYCEMQLAGGGWTLLFNRRAGNLSVEACGQNLADFLRVGCGTPARIGPTDSYALPAAQRTAVPTTQVMLTQYLAGVLDADDAYVVDLSSPNQDLFPDTNQLQHMPLRGVCSIDGTACDNADVHWKFIGDYWYHSARCGSSSSGIATYRGNYGLCTEGVGSNGNDPGYPTGIAFGDRNEYVESKLWGHPATAVDYQERVWARDSESCPSCASSSCGAGNHLEGGACVANTRSCVVPRGTGVQSWEPEAWYTRSTAGGWGACVATSCDSGHRLVNGACVQITYAWTAGSWGTCGGATPSQTYSAWGACSGGTGTWSYGDWGSCSASAVCSGGGTQSRTGSCTPAPDSGSQSRTGACSWTSGSGSQSRTTSCVNNFGETVPDAMCGAATLATTQSCTPSGAPATCGSLSTTQACTPTGTAACGAAVLSQSCQSPAGTQSCLVANGTGTQSCAAGSTAWSACTMTACNSGYVASGGACITDTGPTSCLAIRNAGQTTSGLYTIDPDGVGGVAQMTVYCDMTTAGGGWTLISNRRAGTTNVEACGANLAQFFTNGCGTASAIAAANSYSMTAAQRAAVSKTEVMVTQLSAGVVDADDAYIVTLSSSTQELFPNSNLSQNLPLTRVCNLAGTVCDSSDVFWKYIGDFWFHSAMCLSGTSGDSAYRGNYGVCPNGATNGGAAGAYPVSGATGNRSGYDESKLWGHPNAAAAYQERIWVR